MGHFVFPNSQDFPAGCLQRCGRSCVTAHIPSQLLRPKLHVGNGDVEMFWTSMPETSVDKNHDSLMTKHEVRPDGDALLQ